MNTTLVWDENGDGRISNNEVVCVRYYFKNKHKRSGEAFSFKTDDKRAIFNGPPDFYEVPSAGHWELAISLLATNIKDSTPISLTITETHNDKTKILKALEVPTKPDSVNRDSISKNFKITNLTGIWIGEYYGRIYKFSPDGTYRRETNLTNNKSTISGNFHHYIFKCDGREYISFTGWKNQSRLAEPNEISAFDISSPYGRQTNENFIRAASSQKEGGFIELNLERLETEVPDTSFNNMLDSWVQGKWRNDLHTSQVMNLKSNHEVVEYNPLNKSDFGSWFWTFRKEDGIWKSFLWTVESDVYGTSKYEVDLDKSSENRLVMKWANKDITYTRNDQLDVPEVYVGRILEKGWFGRMIPVMLASGDNSGLIRAFVELKSVANRSIDGGEFYKDLLKRRDLLK